MNTAITPMGNQNDFNYEAWKGIASEWLPQAYGANSNADGDQWDPEKVAQVLIARGVDPNIITPVLAPSSRDYWNSYQGNTAMWTYDDLMTGGLPKYHGSRQGDFPPNDYVSPENMPTREQAPGRRPGPPRLSQSAPMIQEGGLKWFDQTYQDENAFRAALQQQGGQSFDTWAKNHPTAAAALKKRPPVKAPPRRVS
jgi:hypothetical protein